MGRREQPLRLRRLRLCWQSVGDGLARVAGASRGCGNTAYVSGCQIRLNTRNRLTDLLDDSFELPQAKLTLQRSMGRVLALR